VGEDAVEIHAKDEEHDLDKNHHAVSSAGNSALV
jgi:hypothetical protein